MVLQLPLRLRRVFSWMASHATREQVSAAHHGVLTEVAGWQCLGGSCPAIVESCNLYRPGITGNSGVRVDSALSSQYGLVFPRGGVKKLEVSLMSRLLVVSDGDEQRADILDVAADVGFSEGDIVVATSENEADGAINAGPFNVAVVDIMLSQPLEREEGLRVIEKLHERYPECRIIGLTQAPSYDGGKALKAGAHDFIGTKWQNINWRALLRERLKLWRRFVE